MLLNDVTGVLDNTFTDEHEAFGVIETVALCPGGQDMVVTEANKWEYVKLIVRHRLLFGIVDQVCLFFLPFWAIGGGVEKGSPRKPMPLAVCPLSPCPGVPCALVYPLVPLVPPTASYYHLSAVDCGAQARVQRGGPRVVHGHV